MRLPPRQSSKVGKGAVKRLGQLGVGGNFVWCLIIVVIFMRLEGAFRLGGDFRVIIWGTSHKEMGPFLFLRGGGAGGGS